MKKIDINNITDLFNELYLLWALYELGGCADDDILFPKYVEIEKLAASQNWTVGDIINKMLERGYPKDSLEYFLIKTHGIFINLNDITLH